MKTKALLLIAAVVCLLYAPSLRNGFVWDDSALIGRDPLIRSWRLIPEGFGHFLFLDATASEFYRPLQRLSYTLDYALHGLEPWGYHLTNLLLHAGAAFALFLFLSVIATEPLALAVALLWALHPLHSSAVAYVSGRADLLAAIFGFGGLWLLVRNSLWPGALSLLAAMLSKESGIVFLPIALLFFPQAKRRLLPALGLVLLAYLSLRFTAEQTATPPSTATPLAARPILISRAVAEYAGLIVAPLNLHMERDVSSVGTHAPSLLNAVYREYQTLLGVLLIGGLTAWFARSAQRKLLLAFAIAYLPISNLFALNATVAEHWLYLPAAFLFASAALCLKANRWVLGAALLWGILLGARTFVRTFDWKDEPTFLETTIAAGGASSRMHVQLGNLESSKGNHPRAIEEITKALAIAPDQPFALLAMANAQLRSGNFPEARNYLQKAKLHAWLLPQALETEGVLEYKESGRARLDLLAEAVALTPNHWPLRKRYLQLLDQSGQTSQALKELAAFINVHPYRADSWVLLSELLGKADQPESALRAYEQAMAYDVQLSRNR